MFDLLSSLCFFLSSEMCLFDYPWPNVLPLCSRILCALVFVDDGVVFVVGPSIQFKIDAQKRIYFESLRNPLIVLFDYTFGSAETL